MSKKSFKKSKSIAIIGIIAFVFSLFLIVIAAQQKQQTQSTAAASGPLKISSTNPRYFVDSSGKIVYLAGAYSWNYAGLMTDTMAADYLNFLISPIMEAKRSLSLTVIISKPIQRTIIGYGRHSLVATTHLY